MRIEINNKNYEINKLPLGRYVEVIDALDKLPSQIGELGELSEENVIAHLPRIIKVAFPELVRIVSLGSGINEDTIKEEFGLTDFVQVIKAIFDVNEFGKLGEVIKGLQNKATEVPSKEINNG